MTALLLLKISYATSTCRRCLGSLLQGAAPQIPRLRPARGFLSRILRPRLLSSVHDAAQLRQRRLDVEASARLLLQPFGAFGQSPVVGRAFTGQRGVPYQAAAVGLMMPGLMEQHE